MICRHKRRHLNPGPPPALQPASQQQQQPPQRRRIKQLNTNQRGEKGCYKILLADLIHTDILGYQNFSDLIKDCTHHHIKKSVINFRKQLRVGLKLVIRLRHLETGDLYFLTVSLAGWAKPPFNNLSLFFAESSLLNSRKSI